MDRKRFRKFLSPEGKRGLAEVGHYQFKMRRRSTVLLVDDWSGGFKYIFLDQLF